MNGEWYVEAPDVPAGAWRKTSKGAVHKAYAYWQQYMARVRIVNPHGREVGTITAGGFFTRIDDSIRKHVDALDNR